MNHSSLSYSQPDSDSKGKSNNNMHDDDMKKWSQTTGRSHAWLKKEVEYESTRLAKLNGGVDSAYIYRNLVFKDFQGVILTDPNILDIIPRVFPTRPHYPSNSYKIERTPDKGMGMFARRDIRAGGLILIENPVIVAPMVVQVSASGTREELSTNLFNRLDPDLRLKAFKLFNCKPLEVCSMLEGILRSNGLGVDLPQPRSLSPSAPTIAHSGIFLDISRCNHRNRSCGPNAGYVWDWKTFSMTLYASHPIHAGEEITIQYAPIDDSREPRRARLKHMYYFDCNCKYCDLPSDEAIAASDAVRLEVQAIWGNGERRFAMCEDKAVKAESIIEQTLKAIDGADREGLRNMLHLETLAVMFGMVENTTEFRKWAYKASKRWKELHRQTNSEFWEVMSYSSPQDVPWWGRRRGEKVSDKYLGL